MYSGSVTKYRFPFKEPLLSTVYSRFIVAISGLRIKYDTSKCVVRMRTSIKL